jgi:2,3-bisphosphoglycerate-independent phosphoglycerate mutase
MARDCPSEAGVTDIMVHAITDGRDTSPTGGAGYLAKVEDEAAKCGARVATVVGRYYAMDRDKRWDRTKLAWDAIVSARARPARCSPARRWPMYYRQDSTDEFLPPMIFTEPTSSGCAMATWC